MGGEHHKPQFSAGPPQGKLAPSGLSAAAPDLPAQVWTARRASASGASTSSVLHEVKSVGALVLNALIWGVSWWPFRALQDAGLHPLWATAGVYALVFAVLLLASLNSLRSVATSFHTHPALWLLALASGLTNVGFNWAVTTGDVVRVVLLFYLMPAWSVLVAWGLLGEKPTGAALARLALAIGGVLIVLKTPNSPWPLPQGIADWLAIGGGLSFAITNALLRKCHDTPSSARMLASLAAARCWRWSRRCWAWRSSWCPARHWRPALGRFLSP
jgi:drug/metabolite transporter (DMT)-like permease